MRRRVPVLLVQGLLLGVVPFTGIGAQEVTCPTVEAPDVSFEAPQFIDTARAGGEPVSIVGQDGSISVSAHAGTTHVYKNPQAAPGAGDFLVGYFNQVLNWRSTDDGTTWEYIGLAGTGVGPHSPQTTGFSDPDFTIDQAGNIYNTEIDLANVAVFKSPDDGQSYPIGTPEAFSGDRPWLVALEEDEVFLYINSPRNMLRSTDGGVTWSLLPGPDITSKPVPDPLNPDDGIIGPSGSGFAISDDDAQSWESHSFGPMGSSVSFFDAIAVDKAGNVFTAGAGGYQGGTDTNANGQVTFGYYDREEGRANASRLTVPTPAGDALWPWIIAGDEDRVAFTWYQTLAGQPRQFYIYAAVTHNATGTTVECSDGSTRFVEPQFTVVNASGRFIHDGAICLSGTTCNANPSFENGDRRLGDFFTINFDKDGDLFLASGDTTLRNPVGGPKPVGNPIFIRQAAGGDRMLATPMTTRPTRCLFPLPSC
ncbi:MAG TPA: hypothetical protein VGB51_04410 [Actinomycetota bacterium]